MTISGFTYWMAAIPSQTVPNPISNPAAVTAELPKEMTTIAFNSQNLAESKEGVFEVIFHTAKAAPFRSVKLFERADFRKPSGDRWNLYRRTTPPDLAFSGEFHTQQVLVQAFLRECVCISTVFVLSTTKEIGKKQPVMLAFVEFPPGQDHFLIDAFYIDCLEDHRLESINSMWSHIFPPLAYPVDENLTKTVAEKAEQIETKRQIAQFPATDAEARDMLTTHDREYLDTIIAEQAEQALEQALVQAHGRQLSIKQEIEVVVRLLKQNAITLSQEQYKLLRKRMNALIIEYKKIEKHISYIPHGPYHPESHKLNVLLDLDKTLFVSDADARAEQKEAFVGDFEISGNMAITNERFEHRMMIRPGCYWFLRRLRQIANVYAVTAGDLHYARAAVTHANARKWISSKDITTDTEDYEELPPVDIPLTHVFSLRNHAKRAAPKTLERALPWVSYLTSGAGGTVLAVDDDPGAWDVAVRHHVIPISPFQPRNNSHEHLLNVVERIEVAAQRLFTKFHTALDKMSPETPVELPMPTGLPVKVQFFDSGRYVMFLETGLTVDNSTGANKILSPTDVKQFYAEHTPIGSVHTLEYPTGVPVTDVPIGLKLFEDGRYAVIGTESNSLFMAFKYGGVMAFHDTKALNDFLSHLKELVPAFYVGGGSMNPVVPAAAVGAAMPAVGAPIEVDFVRESYNNGQVVLYKVEDGYIATESGKFIMMLLTAEEHAEFVSGLILDRPLNKQSKILFKTHKVVDVYQELVNEP